METNYSNYDMLDKLIANNKKAKSWTIILVTALCILAAAVLWMGITITKQKRELIIQEQNNKSDKELLEARNVLIDSLVANCNIAKTEIVKSYDSAIMKTENAIKAIVSTNVNPDRPIQITETQQKQLKEVSKGIENVKTNMEIVKRNIRKTVTRLFIQYNNKDNSKQVETLTRDLKVKSNYYVAPPEYIDNNFATVIKFYNYENKEEERSLKELVGNRFRLDPGHIPVKYETNPKIKSTIEIWIGTRNDANSKSRLTQQSN